MQIMNLLTHFRMRRALENEFDDVQIVSLRFCFRTKHHFIVRHVVGRSANSDQCVR